MAIPLLEAVVNQHALVAALTGSTVLVHFLVFVRVPGNGRVETGVIGPVHVYRATVVSLATFGFIGTRFNEARLERATILGAHASIVIAIANHFNVCLALGDDVAVFIHGSGFTLNGLLAPAIGIEVNEGPTSQRLKPGVGGFVVVSRIKTNIADLNFRMQLKELMESDNAGDRIVASSRSDTDMQRQINTCINIVRAKHVEGIAIISSTEITVPAEIGFRILEEPGTIIVGQSLIFVRGGTMAVGIGMDVPGGTVTRDGEAISGNESPVDGRLNGRKEEQLLDILFKIERKIPSRRGPGSEPVSNLGVGLLKLDVLLELASLLLLIDFIAGFLELLIEGGREQGLKGTTGMQALERIIRPKTADEVVVRTKGRNGNGVPEITSGITADQEGKARGLFQQIYPIGKAGIALKRHKDEGTKDLGLQVGRTASGRKETGKEVVQRIDIEIRKLAAEWLKCSPLGGGNRIRQYISVVLMQDGEILVVQLPGTQHKGVSPPKAKIPLTQARRRRDFGFVNGLFGKI